MRSRKDVVRIQKAIIFITLVIIAVITVSVCLFSSVKAQAAPADVTYKFYTSVEIQSGDTLWNIASDYYTDDYEDFASYIEEICEINHISCDEIHAGQYLTIPYYAPITLAAE